MARAGAVANYMDIKGLVFPLASIRSGIRFIRTSSFVVRQDCLIAEKFKIAHSHREVIYVITVGQLPTPNLRFKGWAIILINLSLISDSQVVT